jgi:hypothetical protein
VETVPHADRCVAGEVNVRANLAAGSERDVFVDDRVRAGLHAVVQLCAGVNDGGWVDHS